MGKSRAVQIGVIGPAGLDDATCRVAERVGELIAREGATLVCGGLGGAMEAAARGAVNAGGLTLGILPGSSPDDANPYIKTVVVTDMGHARNAIVVRSSHAVIAVGGIRRRSMMERVLRDGQADFISMSRPFIRQPNLVNLIEKNGDDVITCMNCNRCSVEIVVHYNPLKCYYADSPRKE